MLAVRLSVEGGKFLTVLSAYAPTSGSLEPGWYRRHTTPRSILGTLSRSSSPLLTIIKECTEHEKRPRSVNTEEGDSSSEVQLQGPEDDQSEPEVDRSGSEYDPLESYDDSVSFRERSDKHGSLGGGTGNRNGGVSSSGDGSGSSIEINVWNGNGSSGTCGGGGISLSTGGSTTSGSGSGSEADLPEFEYGPLESDDEDRLSATGLVFVSARAPARAPAPAAAPAAASTPVRRTVP